MRAKSRTKGSRPGAGTTAGRLRVPVAVGLLALCTPIDGTRAGSLNTNVALTPAEGNTILRAQWRYSRLGDDPTPMDRELDLSLQPITAVHALTSDFSLLATAPIVHRELKIGRTGNTRRDTGIADVPVLGKYRFFKKDDPGSTSRGSALVGAELPSYDAPFSSESFDPVGGIVFSHQEISWTLDADLVYQLNTAGGLDGDDRLRGDLAYQRRLVGGQAGGEPWILYGVAELNAAYLTDGSTELLGSPGFRLSTPQWSLGLGVQLPIHQKLSAPRLERELTTVLSLRYQF